jgi:hypothetical protein
LPRETEGQVDGDGHEEVGVGVHRVEVGLLDGQDRQRVEGRGQQSQRGARYALPVPGAEPPPGQEDEEDAPRIQQGGQQPPQMAGAGPAETPRPAGRRGPQQERGQQPGRKGDRLAVPASLIQRLPHRAGEEERQRAVHEEPVAAVVGVQRGAGRIQVEGQRIGPTDRRRHLAEELLVGMNGLPLAPPQSDDAKGEADQKDGQQDEGVSQRDCFRSISPMVRVWL